MKPRKNTWRRNLLILRDRLTNPDLTAKEIGIVHDVGASSVHMIMQDVRKAGLLPTITTAIKPESAVTAPTDAVQRQPKPSAKKAVRDVEHDVVKNVKKKKKQKFPDRVWNRYTDNEIAGLPFRNSYPYHDGGGLILYVRKSGDRVWYLKHHKGSRYLGSWPTINVDSARLMASSIKESIRRGEQPSEEPKAEPVKELVPVIDQSTVETRKKGLWSRLFGG